jgi:hypothetical protein
MREAIRLMREAIRLMRDALSLMREALRPDEGGDRATHQCCGRGGLGAEGTQRTTRHAAKWLRGRSNIPDEGGNQHAISLAISIGARREIGHT